MSISARLSYTDNGQGDPLILFHGLGGDGQQWANLLPDSLPHRILLPDLPGHGKTAWLSPAACTFENFAAAVIEWIIQLEAENGKFERLVLGGISMGAGIAVRVALAIPESVNKLILVRPAWLDKPFPANLHLLQLIGEYLQQGDAKQAEARLMNNPEFLRLKKENPVCAQSITGQFSRPDLLLAARTLVEMVAASPVKSFAELTNLSVPALVIGNADDPLHPLAMAVSWADQLSNSIYRQIAPRYTDPGAHRDELQQEITRFLQVFPEA